MKKQIAALGLCAAMVVGSATGCSTASSKETEKAPAADTTTAAGGQADTTAAPETEAAKADFYLSHASRIYVKLYGRTQSSL